MPTKRIIPLAQIDGGSSPGLATINCPRNVRYHGIFLKYQTDTAGGATEANMETELPEVRLNLNEVTQRKASSAQIFDINRTKGRSPKVGDGTAEGFIPIFFSEPQRRTQVEQEMTAWGMLGVNSFQIEVDIADNAAQTCKLTAFAVVDDVQEAPKGIVKWRRNVLQVTQTGETPFKLNARAGDSYQGLHLFENTNGDINNYLLEWDGSKIAQMSEYDHAAYVEQYLGITDVAKNTHLALDGNNPADVLRTFKEVKGVMQPVQEILLTLNMANAANVTVISEMLGLPD